jgi:hypothetical protein
MALPSSTLMRRLMPVLEMTRRRSAAGLKSTEKLAPAGSFSDSSLFFSHLPVLASTVTMTPAAVRPYSFPSAGRTSMPTRLAPPSSFTEPVTFMLSVSIQAIVLPSCSATSVAAWLTELMAMLATPKANAAAGRRAILGYCISLLLETFAGFRRGGSYASLRQMVFKEPFTKR